MGMKGNKGGVGDFDPTANIFGSMPLGPVGGRTAGKVRMPSASVERAIPSLQQQYASLNQGVRGFQPLGIRGYTPPLFAQPFGGFNPFGINAFGGNPFFRPMSLESIRPVNVPEPAISSQIPDFNNAYLDVLNEPQYDQADRMQYERQEMQDYQAPTVYETQVVQGGLDRQVPISQTAPLITNQPQPDPITNVAVGKAGGGRVQGFNVGGMPEQNQTGDRLEEETIMALMGKHPNPKEVFNRYLEAYGEDGLLALAAEVEKMMSSEGRMIDGPGGGVDDFVPAIIDNMQPAALSKDEYVIPADVVAHAGDGSSEAGGKKFDELVARVRKAKTGNTTQPEQIEFEEQIQSVT